MKSVPEILCFIRLLLMPSTLGVVMVVKKNCKLFCEKIVNKFCNLFIHETLMEFLRACFDVSATFQIKLEFGSVGFWGERKTG